MTYKIVQRLMSMTLVTLLLSVALGPTASADGVAANVTKLDGKAFVASIGGVMRALHINDRIYEKERVLTGRKTSLELKFTDGTTLNLGASTIVTVDSYVYRKKTEAKRAGAKEENFSLSLLRGAVRAVTGLLAKRRPFSVRFKVKVATIGIRGTHFAAEVDGDSATIILLAQQDTSASNAIEVYNAFGKVEIDKPNWGTECIPPPAPSRGIFLGEHNTMGIRRAMRTGTFLTYI